MVAHEQRNAFQTHLEAAAIQTATHYPRLITDQEALSDGVRFEVASELSRARRIAAEEVSLPIHPFLSDSEVVRVIDAVNSWVPS